MQFISLKRVLDIIAAKSYAKLHNTATSLHHSHSFKKVKQASLCNMTQQHQKTMPHRKSAKAEGEQDL
jgi:hypothetical protein